MISFQADCLVAKTGAAFFAFVPDSRFAGNDACIGQAADAMMPVFRPFVDRDIGDRAYFGADAAAIAAVFNREMGVELAVGKLFVALGHV